VKLITQLPPLRILRISGLTILLRLCVYIPRLATHSRLHV